MKRKLETQIVMDAISEFGIKPWPKLQTAVALGLKRLRAAKYQERVIAKKKFEAIKEYNRRLSHKPNKTDMEV